MLGLAVFAEDIVDDHADGRNARVRDQVAIAKVAGGARFCGAPAKRPLGMAQVVDQVPHGGDTGEHALQVFDRTLASSVG